MTKEEKEYGMEDFYAQFLIMAQDLVTTKVDDYGALIITPAQDMLKIIHHSVALGLLISDIGFMIEDKDAVSLLVTEYRNMYEDQISQFIPIQKNDKD